MGRDIYIYTHRRGDFLCGSLSYLSVVSILSISFFLKRGAKKEKEKKERNESVWKGELANGK